MLTCFMGLALDMLGMRCFLVARVSIPVAFAFCRFNMRMALRHHMLRMCRFFMARMSMAIAFSFGGFRRSNMRVASRHHVARMRAFSMAGASSTIACCFAGLDRDGCNWCFDGLRSGPCRRRADGDCDHILSATSIATSASTSTGRCRV